MEVPVDWRLEVDKSADKLIYAFVLNKTRLDGFIALRAEQVPMFDIVPEALRTALATTSGPAPSSSGVAPSTLQEVNSTLASPMQLAQWIFLYGSHSSDFSVEGTSGKVVRRDQERELEDTIQDARIVDNALLFRVQTVDLKGGDAAEFSARVWTAKALLDGGMLSIAYVTAPQFCFRAAAAAAGAGADAAVVGPYDGALLDRLAGSLRRAAPAATDSSVAAYTGAAAAAAASAATTAVLR